MQNIQNEGFYDKVLEYNDSFSGYYIALNLKSKEYTGRVIIENTLLKFYIEKIYPEEKNMYKEMIKQILKEKSILDIKDESMEQWGFLRAINDDELDVMRSKGKKEFINTYFSSNGLIKTNIHIPIEKKAAIIYQLFQWEIPVDTDDYSGYPLIEKKYLEIE